MDSAVRLSLAVTGLLHDAKGLFGLGDNLPLGE
jgi:hypothetical protein